MSTWTRIGMGTARVFSLLFALTAIYELTAGGGDFLVLALAAVVLGQQVDITELRYWMRHDQ